MSSFLPRFLPTSASEQTAKEWSGTALSCVHSVSGLGKEVQAGDEEEGDFSRPGHVLGDLEGSEGFPGAAGHDELAAVGGLEAEQDVGLGAGLVLAEFLPGLEGGGGGGLVFRPVDLRIFEIVEVDLIDRRRLAGGGEEAVDVGFPDAVVLGAVGLGDKVDAGVLCGEAVGLRPVREEPDIGVEVGVAGLIAEVGADEFLEVGALFALGPGGGAVFSEDALQGSHELRKDLTMRRRSGSTIPR